MTVITSSLEGFLYPWTSTEVNILLCLLLSANMNQFMHLSHLISVCELTWLNGASQAPCSLTVLSLIDLPTERSSFSYVLQHRKGEGNYIQLFWIKSYFKDPYCFLSSFWGVSFLPAPASFTRVLCSQYNSSYCPGCCMWRSEQDVEMSHGWN